jgi:hypothetical protein
VVGLEILHDLVDVSTHFWALITDEVAALIPTHARDVCDLEDFARSEAKHI